MPQQAPKKDFAGKNKTKDTYDADWVLKKVRGPHGTSSMAWITKKQAKSMREDERQAQAGRNAANAPVAPGVPGTPGASGTPPATAPIDVSGIGSNPYARQPTPGGIVGGPPQSRLPVPGVPGTPPTGMPGTPMPDTFIPTWWNSNAIKNPTDEGQMFANIANALMPTLSPEDQRTMGNYLATNYKDTFGGYANTPFDPIPTKIGDSERKRYLGTQRAQLALNLLDRMKTASGAENMGAGYDFLKNAVNLISQYSTDGVMTRERYNQFTNAIANLSKNTGKDLSAYANLAQMFNLPSFTAGPLVSNTPNSSLFG